MKRIGLISDTHGLLRPEAVAFLEGSDYIIHAGDIVSSFILGELAVIAPVTAVRGNNDSGAWADALSISEVLEVDGVRIYAMYCMISRSSTSIQQRPDSVSWLRATRIDP
jgi:putative phosphoesterase